MLAAVVAAALLAGCGDGTDAKTAGSARSLPQIVVISVDRAASPENVGLVMAQERGYFKQSGFEIWFRPAGLPTRPINYLVGKEVDLAISHMPQVVMAREKGVPVIAIGSLVDRPTAAMIWPEKSKIHGIAGLVGKAIATPGLPFQKAFLQSFLRRGGLTLADVKLRYGGYELVSALAKGEVDAIFGGSWNVEGEELEAQGPKPVVTRVQALGVPPYDELVLIGRRNDLPDGQLIRDLLSAISRGTAAAIEDPEAAARLIVRRNPERKLGATEAELEATLPLLSRSGYMDPDQTSDLVDWMHKEGMIQSKPPVSDLLTDDYVPTQP